MYPKLLQLSRGCAKGNNEEKWEQDIVCMTQERRGGPGINRSSGDDKAAKRLSVQKMQRREETGIKIITGDVVSCVLVLFVDLTVVLSCLYMLGGCSLRLMRRVERQRFVTMSPLRRLLNVWSRSGSGRQARSASRALRLSLNRR